MANTGRIIGDIYTNKRGSQSDKGMWVVFDSANDNAFTVSSTQGDQRPGGILKETVATNVDALVQTGGKVSYALVQGTCTRGHWLRQSATAGRLEDTGFIYASNTAPPTGAVAVALETGTTTNIRVLLGPFPAVLPSPIGDNYNPDKYPASANSLDDEFEGGGSIDAKWTKVNDPAGGNAMDQTTYPGYLRVGLVENTGTDDLAARIQLYQAAPAGGAVATYITKVALGIHTDATQTERGELAQAGIYIMDSVNSQFICGFVQVNDAQEANEVTQVIIGESEGGNLATRFAQWVDVTEFIYLKLEKATSAGYTSANNYNIYASRNGIVWQLIASVTKTFTGNCDRVGIMFRRPYSQAGSPAGEAIVDFFRRTV